MRTLSLPVLAVSRRPVSVISSVLTLFRSTASRIANAPRRLKLALPLRPPAPLPSKIDVYLVVGHVGSQPLELRGHARPHARDVAGQLAQRLRRSVWELMTMLNRSCRDRSSSVSRCSSPSMSIPWGSSSASVRPSATMSKMSDPAPNCGCRNSCVASTMPRRSPTFAASCLSSPRVRRRAPIHRTRSCVCLMSAPAWSAGTRCPCTPSPWRRTRSSVVSVPNEPSRSARCEGGELGELLGATRRLLGRALKDGRFQFDAGALLGRHRVKSSSSTSK